MHDTVLAEPYLTEFVELVRSGAGTRDIHDGQDGPYAQVIPADDEFVERELDRVRVHSNSLCALLERYVGSVGTVLDVGCGTGGTTVALALSKKLCARSLIGVDPNEAALRAAEVRTRGYGLSDRVTYQAIKAGAPLPFEANRFDLITCISVLECVGSLGARRALVGEMCRVVKPGGYIALFTPNALRLREHHTGRLFGNLLRTEGYPWSSPPWQIRAMFNGFQIRALSGEQLAHVLHRRGLRGERLLRWMPWVGLLLPWQKIIARKPEVAKL